MATALWAPSAVSLAPLSSHSYGSSRLAGRSSISLCALASTSYYVSCVGRTSQCSRNSTRLPLALASPYVRRGAAGVCQARRKASRSVEAEDDSELEDDDLRNGLNETVTEALKVMLAEDDKLVQKFKDKIDYFGEFLVQDGEIEAAQFMLILRGMLEHEVYPEAGELKGPYKKAFLTLWSLLEDSGWLLTQPSSAEDKEVPKVDISPELLNKYQESK